MGQTESGQTRMDHLRLFSGCLSYRVAGWGSSPLTLSHPLLAVLQAEADRLWDRWSGMQAAAQERANWLRVVLALAEQFWQGLADLATSLADTQHLVLHMEDAGPEPEGIRSRLSAMQVSAGSYGGKR